MNKSLKLSIAGALGGASLLMAQPLWAAGFSLLEQNTSGLGNSYAGSAAVAEDASTIFYNSAGLAMLDKPSVVVNASAIQVKSQFHDEGSVGALAQVKGGNGGDAGGTTLVPAFYVAVPLTSSITGGVGVNAPFGLKTEYDADWLGRFQAIKSDVKTLNINTALAFKLGKAWSLGVGLNHQAIDAELTSAVNYTAAIFQASGNTQLIPRLEGSTSVKGNDSAWGYDLGLLFQPTGNTKIGLSYRSAMKYSIQGSATFAPPVTANPTANVYIANLSSSSTAAAPTNGPIQLEVKLPAIARLALAQNLGSQWQVLGEVSWTQWSSIPELRITRAGTGGTLKNTTENWTDTWRYAVGANYQLSPAVKLRVGAALDKAPVPDSTRTPRLPDNNRTWYSAGAKVAVTNHLGLDVGYARVTAKDAALNQSDGYSALQGYPNGLISGHQETSINIFGAQATVTF